MRVAAEEVRPLLPQTPIVVFGGRGVWPHNATSTQSAVLKNTGAYPEGIMGSRCSGGGQLPATRSCLVTSENAWFERGEDGLCAIFARDMRAAPGAVVGSGRGRAGVPSRVYLRGVVVVSSALDSSSPAQQQNTSDFFPGGIVVSTCHD